MKTSKEFFDRLTNDESFAREVEEAIKAKREAGAQSYYETIIPVVAERGYEISGEELDDINEKQMSELSEEELGKVSGGTSCLSALTVSIFVTSLGSIAYTLDELLGDEEE